MMTEKIEEWIDKKHPFVVYRKPNETVRFGWFQKNDDLHTTTVLEQSCFVFAPFAGTEKVVFYPDECRLIKDDASFEVAFSENNTALENPLVDKTFHIQLVQKGIDAIQSGAMQKVVLSRQEEIVIDESLYEIYFQDRKSVV